MLKFNSKTRTWDILPTIIDALGFYKTRCGEIVRIEEISTGPMGAKGIYPCGIREFWDISGRIWSSKECDNDIVAKHNPHD